MSQPLAVSLGRRELIPGLLWLAAYQLALAPLLRAMGLGEDPALLNGAYFLIGLMGTALIFRRFLTESLSCFHREPRRLLRGILLGLCLYEFVQVGLGIAYEALLPGLETPGDDSLRALAQTRFPLVAAFSVLMAPLVEETLIRGLVFGAVREKSRPAAYLISALVFGIIHLTDYAGTAEISVLALNLPLYVLPGLALCACYEMSGNIWGPILLHAGINALGMYAMATT